jgi:hypothetical protein
LLLKGQRLRGRQVRAHEGHLLGARNGLHLKAYANFLEKRAWARYDPKVADVERMRRAVESLGFKEVTIVSNEPYVPEPLPTDY